MNVIVVMQLVDDFEKKFISDSYFKNRLTLIRYKLKYHEQLDAFESLFFIVCCQAFIRYSLGVYGQVKTKR